MAENVILAGEKKPLVASNADWKHPASPKAGAIEYKLVGGGIAPSGDLGYAYGSATLDGKTETYLRIWRHELTGWKIAVQLVRL